MNIFSFFSGAGFLDLGFELQNHFNIVFVSEKDEAYNDVYRFARQNMHLPAPHLGHHVEDITDYFLPEYQDRLDALIHLVDESKEETLTGFIGGPPCPDFSVAGRNRGAAGDNGRLSGTYVNLICATHPDFFVFENVRGLYKTARHRQFFEQLKLQLRECGYFMTEQLINALEFGAPQDRDRIILFGVHNNIVEHLHLPVENGELLGFPWEAHKIYNLEEVKAMPWPDVTPYQPNVPTPAPLGIPIELTVQHWWQMNDVEHHPNRNMFFHPRAGLHRFQTKDEGDVERKCYKRLHRWRYSPTACYGNNEVHIHPYQPRRISVAEALAIQTLPADFVLPPNITLTNAFKTIGNGVPYVLARGIADSIYEYFHIYYPEI